ncbi:MAG: Na+/H+ antiporter subunit E [gamma proteobacterium symbiont of Bathyaustriella thionipta]|nr:Na+/H+ antiporter subunit E [gamma proteobacterium symbiont of Bathyaustriella thionipta]MCU7950054.1 Na+/H+ antiporter subunit E [gamma proteobacterium symbiont of Bathyaustriella thionipta]MCU7952411.1 Na+/H+ antiporter subunit E [gamma proteobacterium symbiont of Bathyaustriella thionipta]MCU7956650.1 Na+/H+ antiporter subunit E [gamma proteobacterium symbiont of Bathyaustriella thionipta]MCU7968022.1 Na+/H+ antiporter subunit E [gamma proteobacterium symbiont of Bathyaustriella thionipta
MRHTFTLALSLSVFWLINSGHNTPLMLSLGAISITFVLYIAHRMDVVDHESQPIHLTQKLPGYNTWLIKEIILANILVVKHIWLGNKSISPTMSRIKVSQKTDIGKVIYANSITLTPGTVTINIGKDEFLVHALLQESIDDLQSGEMDRRVTQLESQC